jgi:hypothetical protein
VYEHQQNGIGLHPTRGIDSAPIINRSIHQFNTHPGIWCGTGISFEVSAHTEFAPCSRGVFRGWFFDI